MVWIFLLNSWSICKKFFWKKLMQGILVCFLPLHWSLKSSSAEVTLWWAFTWTQISSHLLLIQKYISVSFPQISVSSIFQFCYNHVPSNSLTIQANQWLQSMNRYIISHLAFFPQAKWTARCTAQSSAYWEDFPSSKFFGGVPDGRCSAAAIHLQWCPGSSGLQTCRVTVKTE